MRDRSETVPRMIRAWSDHNPSMKPSLRNPPRNRGYFSRPPRAFCIEKYNISRSGYHSKFHRIQHLPRKMTLQLHQILRLPRKMNLMTDPCHTWNAIYNVRSNKCHCPNSPNTAPTTKNESHNWSLLHMKRYLQCAEQQVASSNITKYCTCHAKWLSWLILVTYETLWNAIYNARNNRWHPPTSPNTAPATSKDAPKFQKHFSKTDETSIPMREPRQRMLPNFRNISPKQMKRQFQCATDPRPFREWSDHNPRIKPSLRNPPRNRGYFSRPPQAFCIEKYNISRSGYHSKFHQILRLPRKVTLQLHQILRPPRNLNVTK